ncbi:MAG: carboxypeptidase M32 [Geminicoccaceae bacterium]
MGWHYAALEERFRRIAGIDGALAILGWDTAVIMPKKAATERGEQLATLKRLSHDLLTHPETGEKLAAAEDETDLDPWQQANLREMRRKYRHAHAVEPALVEAIARATTVCEMTWREARAQSDFALLAPQLEEVIRLVRETASVTGAALGLSAYDALLDAHQPDLRDAQVVPLFDELGAVLPGLIEEILARQAASPAPIRPTGPFAAARQKELGRSLMARLGFDFEAGRLDESAHPFCGGTQSDIRITTRYREDEIVSALMGVLHETGHALYEAGLPKAWAGQPVGEARGMAVHESQSLLIEMQACRSPAFIGFLGSELRRAFGDDPGLRADNLLRLYSEVERGFIRVDADEATYPLHVILRHRLERHLISGDLAVADLPGAWNDGMRELVGIVPPDDRRGCLQDIHWPVAGFGYFPCYTLGAMLAAQLFGAAQAQLPGLLDAIGRGDFAPLLTWLREKVHGQGAMPRFADLVEQASGGPLAVEPFVAHLRGRYLGETV